LPVRGIFGSGNTAKSLDEPIGTITQRGYGGVVEPLIVRFNGSENAKSEDSQRAWHNSAKSVEEPLPTVTGSQRFGIAESFLTQYNGASGVRSINEPLGTVTTKDRFALIQPEINGMRLDILFRMLQPHELAGAMGFPTNYIFKGAKTAVIKQIGNAVEVNTARALVKSLLTPSREVM
jgi:DNA (cytosine-5)-methyltransferase 1